MSRRNVLRLAFGAVALLLLVGGLFILRSVETPAESPAGSTDAPAPRVAAGRPQPRSNVVANRPPPSADPPASAAATPELPDGGVKWQDADLSKRSVIQREDDSIPRSKDAPPPMFQRETLQAIRAAATPGVEKCKADNWNTYPELAANPEIKASISVVYTATAAAGTITIPTARVVINGFPDDNYANCVRGVFEKLHVPTPAGQADGKGQVSSSFVGKD